jgi:carboxylesterase
MIKICRNKEMTVRKSALPCFMEGGEKAVLLLHGWNSHPGVMNYLGKKLNKSGFTVSIPRLPGHGTNAADFADCTAEDWLNKAVNEYIDLAGKYRTVYVCGLSMGGVLALILAARFNIPKTAVAAPAICNYNKMIKLTPIISLFAKKLPPNRAFILPENADEDQLYFRDELWKWQWPGPANQLRRLQNHSKKILKEVKAETLILMSKTDHAVPPEAAGLILRGINSDRIKTVNFENSIHELVNGEEKEAAAEYISAWFTQ